MADDDDYLSDKFLVDSVAPKKAETYTGKRIEALRAGEIKHQRNRKRSRRELEEEARQEGLSKSLFERAEEDAQGSKAMNMMLKMGFKPGQALGEAGAQHRAEPLPVQEWQGRKGVGLGKRAMSPGAMKRVARMAQFAETAERDVYRSRAREEYEERRAEGRVVSARRTCVALDQKADVPFNVFWLDLLDPESFPPGLLDALALDGEAHEAKSRGVAAALRRQMRADALRPLGAAEDVPKKVKATSEEPQEFSEETMESARLYLTMNGRGRLAAILAYLRDTHHYCFWCGTQYESGEEMASQCPGVDEDSHD